MMSDTPPPCIKVVCEGKTDFEVIDAVLAAVLKSDYTVNMIQPEVPVFAGAKVAELAEGWKGVRSWCQKRLSSFSRTTAAVLVVHIDADVARDPAVDCARPCPPASATADALRGVIEQWAGGGELPQGVVVCIPSQTMDAWVYAALYADNPRIMRVLECRRTADSLLADRREKLARKSGRRYRKDARAYVLAKRKITDRWPDARKRCSQAERFSADLAKALGVTEGPPLRRSLPAILA